MNVRASRSGARLLAGALLALGMATTGLPGSAQTAQTAPPGPDKAKPAKGPKDVLDKDRKGQDAIDALGAQLDDVAKKHKKTRDDVETELRQDDTLWVDRTGRLYYVEPTRPAGPELAPTAAAVTASAPLYDYSQTFLLHSRPGANRTIYLDFDGHFVSGTAWNSSYNGGADYTAVPYSIDADPAFSNAELEVVQSVWARVAEDYSAFDVDVTTQLTSEAVLERTDASDQQYGTRVVITNTTIGYSKCGCGGVAYVGVFDMTGPDHEYYQPAWVFEQGLGSGPKNLAEAASHEAGHNLGLSHDGTSKTGYYAGQGAWAPIMGVGYYEPITQWSKGEYTGANNKEDDFVVMQGYGLSLRADTEGSSAATAVPLAASGSTYTGSGTITTRTDLDYFSFPGTVGQLATFTVTPRSPGADLDASLELLDPDGISLGKVNPASAQVSNDTATGLDATITATLAKAGTYTLVVDGVGAGSASSTGYSDYASVGNYALSGAVATNQPPVVQASASPTSGPAGMTVQFSSTGSSDPEGKALTYAWDFGDGTSSTAANPSHAYPTAGTFAATLTVSDGGLSTTSGAITIDVTANAAPTAVAGATPTKTGPAPATVQFSSAGSFDPDAGQTITYLWNFGNGVTSTAANPSYTYPSAGAYTATLKVTDTGGLSSTASVAVLVGPVDVASVSVSAVRTNNRNVTSTATVLVSDGSSPVGSVSVAGKFTFGTSSTNKSATTNTSGVATVSSGSVRSSAGTSITYCVTGLSKTGTFYSQSLLPSGTCATITSP